MNAELRDIEDDDESTNVDPVPLVFTPEVRTLAARPYSMVVWHDDADGWCAIIPDLPGLTAVGDTLDEMYTIAEEAKRLWIASALRDGDPIPAPRDEHALVGAAR